jgi:hypothetical protein
VIFKWLGLPLAKAMLSFPLGGVCAWDLRSIAEVLRPGIMLIASWENGNWRKSRLIWAPWEIDATFIEMGCRNSAADKQLRSNSILWV